VKYKNVLSTPRNIEASVPQGSVLGPIAFNIFVSDYPTWNNNHHLISQYADVTTILEIARSPNAVIESLQNKIIDIENWCTLYKIALNGQKPKLLINRRNRTPITESLEIFDEEVETTKELKFLGVTLTHNFKWTEHIKNVIVKTKGIRFKLNAFIGRKSTLDTRNGNYTAQCCGLYGVTLAPHGSRKPNSLNKNCVQHRTSHSTHRTTSEIKTSGKTSK